MYLGKHMLDKSIVEIPPNTGRFTADSEHVDTING